VATFAGGKIEAYLGPTELNGPDDLETVITGFIAEAKQSLDVAVQEIDSVRIAEAILDARWRGVQVEIFLEQDYLRSKLKAKPDPPAPAPGETPEQALRRVQWRKDELDLTRDTTLARNRWIMAAFLRSGIEVRGDYNPKIFHQKFILRDYRKGARPTTALLTGSANFTDTDTHKNLNSVFVFHDADVCRQYRVEVEQLRRASFGRAMHGEVPKTYDLGGVPVKILFAPDHTPELEFMKQMLKVKDQGEIWFAIFTFAGSSGIDDTMLALARGGVKIRGVLDPAQAKQKWAVPQWLKHDNIELRVPKKEGDLASLRKVHHKLMVIDDRIVVAGSFNYTQPANVYNDENLFVIGSPHKEVEGIEVASDPVKDVAVHVRAEIERIFNLSKKYVPA
jgi:phosphatidylserine/phosphatidylglycerophosphate/cardiolipin synthase-like enzyme